MIDNINDESSMCLIIFCLSVSFIFCTFFIIFCVFFIVFCVFFIIVCVFYLLYVFHYFLEQLVRSNCYLMQRTYKSRSRSLAATDGTIYEKTKNNENNDNNDENDGITDNDYIPPPKKTHRLN